MYYKDCIYLFIYMYELINILNIKMNYNLVFNLIQYNFDLNINDK